MTTIASSTTKPVAIASAMSERLSRLYPSMYIAPKVPINETGTTTLGISVARMLLRNAKTTRMTRAIEIIRVRSTSRTEARMVVVRSCGVSSFIVGGMSAWSCGSSAMMRSTVSMMLAPGCRKMTTMTAGLRLAFPAVRVSSTESSTRATSDSRTAAPDL
jgi:hypothetical protein